MHTPQIDEGILCDNNAPEESTLPIDSRALKEKIDAINLENRSKRELRQIKKLNEEYLPKLQEYEKHLETMDERNSYSKTDPDETFMRMKEDHMKNGQLKPGYNLQISTEKQFITNHAFYHNPGDTLTLISFLLYGRMRYFRFMEEVCANVEYGSEENYEFMERFGISAYGKYNYFHVEQTKNGNVTSPNKIICIITNRKIILYARWDSVWNLPTEQRLSMIMGMKVK